MEAVAWAGVSTQPAPLCFSLMLRRSATETHFTAIRGATHTALAFAADVVTYGGGQLEFATVRGAGHMVPEFRPIEAAELMRRWLAEEPLQPYNGSFPRLSC